ncbi:phosphotransferase [Arthrobacter sp. 2MCAF15]|uniref:phosphotransferase n=1 Tax=Arthrobacter sp. 2MCAF15 TaxID=3232984 RepID=UPI003F8F6D56
MGWHPPVPAAVVDEDNTEWEVVRSWPGDSAEEYVLELAAPGRAGVRAGHLRAGQLELLQDGRDRRLPALKLVSPLGVVVVHRAHKRAVVRAGEHYLKIFRIRQADEAAGRHARMNELLGAEDFLTPEIVSYSQGCLTLKALPGRSLFELGNDPAVSDAEFEMAWQQWSRAWVRQHSLARTSAQRPALEALPSQPAAVELENLRRIVNPWLVHTRDVAASQAQRTAVLVAAGQAAEKLLLTDPDPLAWSHGDLHDKQIFTAGPGTPLGLLDFDQAGRAEAAADLANLAVHLQLRLRQHRLTAERYQTALHHVAATAEELRVTPVRFDAYASTTRLRLGCLYSFRPQWAALAEEFLVPDGEQPLAAGIPAARVGHTY